MINSLKHLANEDSKTDTEDIDIYKTIDQLKSLLEDNDTEAVNIMEKLKKNIKTKEHGEQLELLCSHIENYDFEDALNVLNKLKQSLEKS
ncbi:hypothetical protein MCHI_000226 [Candidatus Magnetoovum chiemensis]|nr:hypothetical protein MCHI_000226 [Candidatus Magnetoovum chiemensis]